MDTHDKDVVEELLRFIHKDEFHQALKTWFDYRQAKPEVCQNCLYTHTVQKPDDCGPCLEAKLRTMSLYHHDGDEFEALLVDGARKLSLFYSQQNS